jgi:NADPH:quinone reductase-like Zn-dependent oxidoreductase
MNANKMPVRTGRKRKWLGIVLLVLVAVIAALWAYRPAPRPLRAGGTAMQAIVYHDYGAPEVLRLEAIDRPVPSDKQVLIQVRAASVNPLDWHYLRGIPYLVRMDAGLHQPKDPQLGVDLAGVVVAVGKSVTRFKPGDEVFGVGPGAFAEYARASENKITLKPAQLTFEQAAAVPVAAMTALQGLRDKGKLQPGQKVLINGASGGVGTFAVQIAKSLGADVTGVCSTKNVELVRSLGADRVIDYTKEDFTQGATRYDVIFDTVGNRALSEYRAVMTAKGTYIGIGGGGPKEGNWIGALKGPLKSYLLSPFVSQELVTFMAAINKDDLAVVTELIEAGKVKPVIDRTYPLAQVPEAIRYLEEGHARGKVVISLKSAEAP